LSRRVQRPPAPRLPPPSPRPRTGGLRRRALGCDGAVGLIGEQVGPPRWGFSRRCARAVLEVSAITRAPRPPPPFPGVPCGCVRKEGEFRPPFWRGRGGRAPERAPCPPPGPPPPAPSPGPRRPPRPRPGCREDSLDSDWSDGGAAGIMRTVCEGGGPGHGGGRGNESLFGASKHTDPFPSVPRNTRMVLHGALASVCVGGEGLSDCVVVLIFTQRVPSCVFFAWHRPSTCPPKCLRGPHLNSHPLYWTLGCHHTSAARLQPLHLLSLGVASPARASRAQGLIFPCVEHAYTTPPHYNLLLPNSRRGPRGMHGHDIGGSAAACGNFAGSLTA